MRSTRHALALALTLAGATLPAVAFAQDIPPADTTKFTADFGYIQTDGNSEVRTLSVNDRLERRTDGWLFTQEGIVVWGETDGVESAGRYGFRLRADRDLSGRLSVYGLAEWNRNTFAGISRQFDENVGLVFKVITPRPHALDLEAGAGLQQRKATTGLQDDFPTTRAGLNYAFEFSEKSSFTARGAYVISLEDSDNGQGEARLGLTAPLAGAVALKVSYDLLYQNRPQPGFEKVDTTFGVGVQVAL